jgi:isopenicillin-N epimerase
VTGPVTGSLTGAVAGWQLDPQISYLNHGSFGVLPIPVAEAAAELRREVERNPADLLVRRLPGRIEEVRGRVADLLGADPASLVFVDNATTGTATVIAALAASMSPGDEVLTTDHCYPAVSAQLAVVQQRYGVEAVLAHVPMDVASTSDVVAAILERATPRTRLLVVDGIASPSGLHFPVAEIVTAAHDRGIPVLVDAAHLPGQVAVDLRATDADFWAGNLHKWVCCQRGLAVLQVAPSWRSLIRPLVASHGYAEGFQPAFDWTGTRDPVPLLSVPAALDYWDQIGWDTARTRQRALVDTGAEVLAAALGTCSPKPPGMTAAMRIVALPVELDLAAGHAVRDRLHLEHRVEVAVLSLHGRTWLRVCGQIYNTPGDYERLASVLPGLLTAGPR